MPDGDSGAYQPQQKPPPRASSPAKRLHSDMADDNMDLDAPAAARRNSGQSSPRPAKILPAAASQRSARATSVDMADAPNNNSSSEAEASKSDSSATSMEQTQNADAPSLDEQVTKVMVMMQSPLKEQQEGYVISEKWLERVWARTTENSNRPHEFSKDATEGPIGPVDNSGLVDESVLQEQLTDEKGEDFVPLNKAATMGQDFEIIPTQAWELVVDWYGLRPGTPVIRRYAHNTVPDKSSENIEYELHPPVLSVRKVRKAPHTSSETSRSATKVVASRYESFLSFLNTAKQTAGIDANNKARVWRILETIPVPTSQKSEAVGGMPTPDASPRGGSPSTGNNQLPLVMDATSFNNLTYGEQREMVTGKDEKASEDFNASLTLAAAGITQDQVIVLEEHDEGGSFMSDMVKIPPQNKSGLRAQQGLQSSPASGRTTPSGPVTRGKAKNGKVRGHTGLTNLGNTCYMNSALQCLRSAEELSIYFLSNKWKDEVNADNPIGHKGAIAKVYAALLSSIYSVDGTSSVSPKNFKQTIGKANSLFSGYGQQDSQEFVSWLVDALHEDLNRVRKKPYRENPDSDDNTYRDPNLIKALGETYRDNHKARNDSVALDLFGGFYKNTMVCPECEKVSITFDPYSQLTLQLPIEQSWSQTVTYVPLSGRPCRIEVDINKNASITALKEYVGKRGGNVPANRIMTSEVYSNKFYKHIDDKLSIAETNIGSRDDIWFYELDNTPSNWPPPKKKAPKHRSIFSHGSSDEEIPEAASPLHDRILVPVFNRGPSQSSYRSNNLAMVLNPFFVVLTREEAKDYDSILRKVLAKVAQMTTRPFLEEISTTSSTQDRSQPGSDVVLTTEEDASPTDPNIKDGSVEGEDMVEVTMTDSINTNRTQTSKQHELPAVLQPGSFIPEACRQLFEMKHTRRSNETVTTGWSTLDHSRTLDAISKRIRIPTPIEESAQSSPAGSEGSSSDEDEADTPQSLNEDIDAEAAIDAANVSSDEDAQSFEKPPVQDDFPRGGRNGKKKNKKQRKQERRLERKHRNNKSFRGNKNKVAEQPNYPEEKDDDANDYLVRMGEAIVLDWVPNSFEALFGGSSADDSRGQEVLKSIETLADPEIEEKKARRTARRKNGITLDECFTETAKSEVLSEDNAWYCNRCKELRRATKTLDIWTVPDVLIIHLKRFSGFRTMRDKVDEFVDFPVEGLDLTGKVGFPEDKALIYDLFAVDNHYGGLGGGHYTATAQNFFDKQWYDYNDSIVSKSSGDRAVNRNAYLLFYRRRSPHPLGPSSLQSLVRKAESDPNVDSEDDDDENERPTRSMDAGNGQRLDASSRNGSSSAFIGTGAGAGAGVLLGAGSQLSQAGRTAGAGAEQGNMSDEDGLPPYSNNVDEGYVDADEDATQSLFTDVYDHPTWSFNNVDTSRAENSDDMGSNSAVGSIGRDRMDDFNDEDETMAHASTPIEGIGPRLGGEDGDDDVHEIRVSSDNGMA